MTATEHKDMTKLNNFLLVVCNNNDSISHRCQDITIFTVYVTSCDLEKSFLFINTVEITSHVY